MLTENQMLILFFCFTMGAVLRTLWGFLWKYLEEPDVEWDHKYTMSMVVSIVLTFIFAVTSFSAVEMPAEWGPMLGFSFISVGFTANSLFNDVVTHLTREER